MFLAMFSVFFTEFSQTFTRWVRTGMHAVSKVSEPTVDLKFFLQ